MTSLQSGIKQSADQYFIVIGDLRGDGPTAAGTGGTPGSLLAYRADLGRFSTAQWAYAPTPLTGQRVYSSLIATAGAGILKDMGRTIVSASRTFRKVQLVVPGAGSGSTFGVAGETGVNAADYLTGYIELGFEGAGGVNAKVAKYGR